MTGGKGAPTKQRLPAALADEQTKKREFCVTIIFSILSRSKMIDDAGGVIFPHQVHSSHIAHTIAWEDGSFDYYDIKDEEKKPEEQRVIRKTIYIDCGDLKINPSKIVNPDSKQMLEKLKRAAEVTKGFLDINTAKGYKGTVHFIICGYAPAEALVFAFDMLVRKKKPSQKIYQDYISSIPDNYLKTFDPYTEETFKFEVDYRCVYNGYGYQSPMPEDPYMKQRHIEKKLDDLRYQQYSPSNSRASAEWEYLDRTEKEKGHVAGVDYPRRDQVEYKGKFWTKEELEKELDRVKLINLEKKTAADEYEKLPTYQKEEKKVNQVRDEYFRISKKNQSAIDKANELEQQLYKQQFEDESPEAWAYDQGLILHQEEGIEADYHSIDTIEYESEYVTLTQLNKIRRELKAQIDKAGDQVLQAEADAEKAMKKADKEELRKTLKIIQLAAGIGSLVIGPLAIIDLAIEVYDMIEDGDLSHLWAIGADLIAVAPLVGGVASKALKAVTKGAVKVEKGATEMSNIVYNGVKTGEQLDSTVGLAGRVEQTVKAGEEGKNLNTLRGTGVWVSEETASVGSKMSSYVNKEQAYSSYLSAEKVSTQASKDAKAAEEAYNNAKIANKAAYDRAYNEAYEKSIQKMLAEEGSYRGVTKEMQEAADRRAKEVADATLKATEIKAAKEAAAKQAAEEAAKAKKTAEAADPNFVVAYEGNIDKVTVMKGRLDLIRSNHWKKHNELGKMLYESNKSTIAIKGFVQDATLFISNFDKLNAKSKVLGSAVLLKDSYSNYFTVKGIVENGYAVYKF